ncbi:MAG: DUF4384 domain-containing protein [Nitrospirae bacterium]|nr:MAG: DUF4384 domain-containing protein [Nitrospirota bacterium]
MRFRGVIQIASVVLLAGLLAGRAWAGPQLAPEPTKPVSESGQVQGSACQRMGEGESLLAAQKKALSIAREAMLQKIKAFAENAELLSGQGIDHEVVAAASRIGLTNERITRQTVKGNQVCVWLTAMPNSPEISKLIKQRVHAKELAKKVQEPELASASSNFKLKVWTNHKAGEPFIEGERLIIYVESEKDAYLKLDYYTAEGKVVHLVPNVFTTEARIQGAQPYSFGAEGAVAEFKISPPFGAETIRAWASTVPFAAALTEADQVSDAAAYLEKVQTVMKSKAHDPTWAAAMVALQTSNKEDLQVAREREERERKKRGEGR